jgi:4-azaleucine resistance transporter AzlC
MLISQEFKTAFKVSIPVMMGYIVLGFAFGLLIVSLQYAWYIAVLMSIFIYAGALQFLAIGFFSSKLGLVDLFLSSIFVNIRQSFYGLSVLKKFKNTKFKAYLIFGLTDETYALLTSVKEKQDLDKKYYYFYLTLLNQIYWVSGTVLGAIFGSMISFNTKGLEFSLTALFVVLAIEQYKVTKKYLPFIIATIACIISYIFIPIHSMLLASILISLVLMFIFKKSLLDV